MTSFVSSISPPQKYTRYNKHVNFKKKEPSKIFYFPLAPTFLLRFKIFFMNSKSSLRKRLISGEARSWAIDRSVPENVNKIGNRDRAKIPKLSLINRMKIKLNDIINTKLSPCPPRVMAFLKKIQSLFTNDVNHDIGLFTFLFFCLLFPILECQPYPCRDCRSLWTLKCTSEAQPWCNKVQQTRVRPGEQSSNFHWIWHWHYCIDGLQ